MRQINRLAAYDPDGLRSSSAGPNDELERLIEQCEGEIRAFVFTLLPNWSDVDDVLQRTRIVLWQKFAAYQAGSSFKAWALQVARHEVSNFRRGQLRDRLCFDDALIDSLAEVRSSLANELEQRLAALQRCLQKLRASDRQIIRQCYGPSATTTKAAAERLHRPVNTLYKALNRIRRTLMECVQHVTEEEKRED